MQWCPGQNCVCFQRSAIWGPNVLGHLILDFSLVSFCTEISSNSLNLLVVLYVVDNEIARFFSAVLHPEIFWNCCSIYQCSLSQRREPLPIFITERLSLYRMLFLYPVMLQTCCQKPKLIVRCSISLLLPLSQFFWKKMLTSISKWGYVIQNTIKFFSFTFDLLSDLIFFK